MERDLNFVKRTLSALLRFYRHGSNAGFLLAIGAIAFWLTSRHVLAPAAPWAALGLAMFPLYEYIFHRFVLHTRPSRWGWLYRLQRIVHYDHHEDTRAIALYFAPLWISIPLVAATAGLYQLLDRGNASITLGLIGGNLVGFLYYEWVHYRAHEPLAPLTPWGRYMKKYHLWHHHKNENLWFGVTSPLIDYLAGTYRPVELAPSSPTTHHLHGTRRPPNG